MDNIRNWDTCTKGSCWFCPKLLSTELLYQQGSLLGCYAAYYGSCINGLEEHSASIFRVKYITQLQILTKRQNSSTKLHGVTPPNTVLSLYNSAKPSISNITRVTA
jgi:hypothetical protein